MRIANKAVQDKTIKFHPFREVGGIILGKAWGESI